MKALTLEEVLTHTIRHRWARQRSGESAIGCARRVLELLGPEMPVHRVREDDVRRIVATLRFQTECSPATVNRHLSALKSMLSAAKDLGAVKAVPAMPWLPEPRGRTRWLSKREQRELFLALNLHNTTVATLCTVLVETGLRVGEALALRWEDVQITGRAHLVVRFSKNGEQRWVPLTADAVRALCVMGCKPPYVDGVYHGLRTGPFAHLSQSTINHTFRAAREELPWSRGDREIVPHCLRHTCASRLVRMGVSAAVIQAWLGHRDMESTMRYMHVDEDGLSAAARLLEGVG